jgi:alpha-tubulin suppressor-like RCC1 family protein
MTRLATTAALLLVSLAACVDQPTAGAPAAEPPAAQGVLAQLSCTADVAVGTVSCAPSQQGATAGGARYTVVTVGGQHHYVRLANSGTVYDAVAGTFSTTVTVQNLLLAALGTADGATAHASGVRVFFASGPTNGVTVANATGQAIFLNSNADYFQYSGADLGDGILISDETSAGKVWTFNTNGASTFAFSVYVQAEAPAGVDYTARFVQVTGGVSHTCGLTQEGEAFCWGGEPLGQLGNGTALTADQGVPSRVQMPAGVSFSSIKAGFYHTCALGSDASAYCWGRDDNGQLGNGSTLTDNQPSPSQVQMPAGVSFSSIAAGANHTCALGSDASAYCWGNDGGGQLGNGSTLTASQPSPSQMQMPTGVSFSSIAAGNSHTCAMGSDARAYCWGTDINGQLGNGTALTSNQPSPSRVQVPAGVSFSSIETGGSHTCALGSDASAYCWGRDDYGQLGNGSTLTGNQPSPSRVQMPAGVSFSSIEAGGFFTCALGSDAGAYCWGWDGNGQLGNGTTLTANQPSPSQVEMPVGVSFSSIVAGNTHTCTVGSGPAYCWGFNAGRQVGDGTALHRAAPVVVAGTR